MNTQQDTAFKLEDFMVINFSIDRKPVQSGDISFSLKPSGLVDIESNSVTLALALTLKDDNDSFNISMSALGIFQFKNIESKESIPEYFYINAPAIVFPYIRSYISTITSLSGLNVVNLPTMNLTFLVDELKGNFEVVEKISES